MNRGVFFIIPHHRDAILYEDFCKSNCQLLLLIADCRYVEIYTKDPNIAKVIYENALLSDYTEVEYVTDSNDCRERMDIR